MLDKLLTRIFNRPQASQAQLCLDAYLRKRDRPHHDAILALAPDAQAEVLVRALARLGAKLPLPLVWREAAALEDIAAALARRKLPLSESQLIDYLRNVVAARPRGILTFLRQLEWYSADDEHSPELIEAVRVIEKQYKGQDTETARKVCARVAKFLGDESQTDILKRLKTSEAWSNTFLEHLGKLDEDAQRHWLALIRHCDTASTPKPSKRWIAQCAELLDKIDPARHHAVLTDTLLRVATKPGIEPADRESPVLKQRCADLLRGLVWTIQVRADAKFIPTLGACAEKSLRKVPEIGAPAARIGYACLNVLAEFDDPAAIAQISRLKSKIKTPAAGNQIAAALERAAERAGLSQDELEEIAVPKFGFTQVGQLRQPIGDFHAILEIVDSNKTKLTWQTPAGKIQKAAPKSLAADHAKAVKQIKQATKDIEKILPGQRDRIERFLLYPRAIPYINFRQRYLDHPLVGAIARRLIWQIEQNTTKTGAFFYADQLVDAQGQPISTIPPEAEVTLWNPAQHSADQIHAWRSFLEDRQITQPFKQAHREIYILTDAERATNTYSNRFAAHILKQHQFNALATQRGWRYNLQGQWDSGEELAVLELRPFDLRAEFWVQTVTGEYNVATTGAGVFLNIVTDQVRFYRMREDGPLPLEQVPPRIFSEVMRDIDLFVGVASVGNDPNWQDTGPEGHRTYWESYAFGNLTATAQTRRELLQRLIPKLKIADRCSLADQFLVVKGDLRSYKIHLGSANILMTPNNQYLCIVPDRSAKAAKQSTLYLPFEGDSTLSHILSKAFMLAEDTKISDPTINSQIRFW